MYTICLHQVCHRIHYHYLYRYVGGFVVDDDVVDAAGEVLVLGEYDAVGEFAVFVGCNVHVVLHLCCIMI